jgi:hypothetical protein
MIDVGALLGRRASPNFSYAKALIYYEHWQDAVTTWHWARSPRAGMRSGLEHRETDQECKEWPCQVAVPSRQADSYNAMISLRN